MNDCFLVETRLIASLLKNNIFEAFKIRNILSMKKIFSLCVLFLFSFYAFAQETFPVNGIFSKNHTYYALTNAVIHVDAETVLEKGTLLIKDGQIVDVAAEVKLPAGTVVLDMKGKHIYPSFIELYSTYGMPEVRANGGGPGPQIESNTKGAYDWNQAIKPETEAYKVFSADRKVAEELRNLGFGSVLSSQKDGIARGTACFVTLADNRENEIIVKDRAAALYSFSKGVSTQDYPSSQMGSIALLRQTYLDADWHKNNKVKKEFNISLDAWNNLQTLPQLFETRDKLEALRADKLGDEFKVQYIIKGSGDEYQQLDKLKSTFAKFIIPLNFPAAFDVEDPYDAELVSYEDLKHWEFAPANAAFMEKKIIPFALTTADLKDKKEFWKNLRKAIEYGLSEKTAFKALTTIPAEMMGVNDKEIGRAHV